jgi:hypothetical protein
MLRTGTTISGKYKTTTKSQNTAHVLKNQESTDNDKYKFIKSCHPSPQIVSHSDNPISAIPGNPATNATPEPKSEGNSKQSIRNLIGNICQGLTNGNPRNKPYEASTTANFQENEVKCEVCTGKPYTAPAVTVNNGILSTQPGKIVNEYDTLNPQHRTCSNLLLCASVEELQNAEKSISNAEIYSKQS